MSIIQKTANYVKETLQNDASGHDWWHIYRVWKTAQTIAKHYPNADHLVIELTALLHDIADWKNHDGDFDIGPKTAEIWLSQFNSITTAQIKDIKHNIKNISFKGANAEIITLSLEGQIVQDADRLDAIGAIGIARTFAFGGNRGHLLHDPNVKPIENESETSYVKGNKVHTTINHFYEKLLLLKERFNTKKGKELALERHNFMKSFLNQFYNEWDGKK